MSGGSYNYLYACDDMLANPRFDHMLERIGGIDAEIATRILRLKTAIDEFKSILDDCRNLFQSIEWCDSCDTDGSDIPQRINELKTKWGI